MTKAPRAMVIVQPAASTQPAAIRCTAAR
jgi:hypothetical protein